MSTTIIRAQENSRFPIHLSDPQVRELKRIGRELASRNSHWADSNAATGQRSLIDLQRATPTMVNMTVRDAVGIIAIDDLQIEIFPKIDRSHFDHLLQIGIGIPRSSQAKASIAASDDYWSLVCAWFLTCVENLLRTGLLPSYSSHSDDISTVRGRVHPLRTSVLMLSGHPIVACRFDELDLNSPLNRLIRSGLSVVLGSRILDPELRRRARRLDARFTGVAPLQPSDLDHPVNRNSRRYLLAVDLAKHVLAGVGRSPTTGSARSWSFLLKTPEIIESAIRQVLATGLAGMSKVAKRKLKLTGFGLTLNPDLVFDDHSIADVKYKVVDDQWNRPDLYQAVAFAEGFRVERAAILAFATADRASSRVSIGDIRVSRINWQIGPTIEPTRSEERFVAEITRWLCGDSRVLSDDHSVGGRSQDLSQAMVTVRTSPDEPD